MLAPCPQLGVPRRDRVRGDRPAAVDASAVRTPDLLSNAVLVVDHFHLVAKANDVVTKVRQRVTWDQRSRRGRVIDPEWANRGRLLRRRDRLARAQTQYATKRALRL
nr:transposase [Rhodococcus sp. BP22]